MVCFVQKRRIKFYPHGDQRDQGPAIHRGRLTTL
jgi:hypothetical protein